MDARQAARSSLKGFHNFVDPTGGVYQLKSGVIELAVLISLAPAAFHMDANGVQIV